MELPVEESLRWLVSRYARLQAAHGDAIGAPELVQPNSDFFPDQLAVDPAGIATLFTRMLGYAPVAEDLPFGFAFVEPDAATSTGGGGCGGGACGTKGGGDGIIGGVTEMEQGYGVTLAVADTGNPVLLTTALARSVGSIVLAEAGEEVDEGESGAMGELAAAVSGFGVLLTCGSYVYAKGCGGVRVRQATHLPVEELTVLLALFLRLHDKKPSLARGHLDTTQKEAFDEALRWVDSNPALVQALRSHPETLADGLFPIEPVRGLLGRFFAKRKDSALPTEAELARVAKRPTRTPAELQRLAETKALVEDALRTR